MKYLVVMANLGLAHLSFGVPQELIDGLGDESFQLRESSEQKLTKWLKGEGEAGVKELEELREKTVSPELKSRLSTVISDVTGYKAIPNTRGYMGIEMFMHLGGVGVKAVMPGTPAAKAGLEAGDVIVEIDGIDLSDMKNAADEAMRFLSNYVKNKKAGEKLKLKLERGGQFMDKVLKLADYKKMDQAFMFRGGLGPGGMRPEDIERLRLNMEQLNKMGKNNLQLIPDMEGGRLQFRLKLDANEMKEFKFKGGGGMELKFKIKPGAGGEDAKPRKFIKPKVEEVPVPDPRELIIPTE